MNLKNKISIGRFWHCHEKAFERYGSFLTFENWKKQIPTLIQNGFYRDANYQEVPRQLRKVGVGYYVVEHKGCNYIVVLDQFKNEIKTILQDDNIGFLVDIFESEFIMDLRYKLSQMLCQMEIELGRLPTFSELSIESGISEEIINELMNYDHEYKSTKLANN